MKRRNLVIGALAAAGAATHLAAWSADYPNHPIKLILPFSAGGPTDNVARLVATKLGEKLGQPLVIENREGAGGLVATEAVVRAPADGYTLLFHTSGLAIVAAINKNMKFDPVKSLEPIGMVATIPIVLLAGNSIPANSPKEFFDYLRANPGKLNYGSGGVGNATHVGMEQILQATGTNAVHIAFKGTAPSMLALMSGQVQFMSDSLVTALPQIKEGHVKAIAVLAKDRAPSLPNVPTLSETLIPGLDQAAWQGLWAPPGTPKDIIAQLNAALNAVMSDPAVKAQLAKGNVSIRTSTPQELGTFLAEDIARWKKVAQAANISVD